MLLKGDADTVVPSCVVGASLALPLFNEDGSGLDIGVLRMPMAYSVIHISICIHILNERWIVGLNV